MKRILSIVKKEYPSQADKLWVYESCATHKPFMFLMQNPGGLNNLKSEEGEQIKKIKRKYKNEHKRFEKEVECHRQYFISWFKGKNGTKKKFGKGFEKVFIECFPLKFSNDNFLEKFYVTDFIKVQSETKKLSSEDFKGHWFKVLDKEIQKVKPRLIIIFGARVWGAFKELDIKLEGLSTNPSKNERVSLKIAENITDAHGYPFWSSRYKCFLIPLVHMSNQPFQNTLRNSYFDYLKEGLLKIETELDYGKSVEKFTK